MFGAPSLFGMSLGEALPILLFELYAAGGDPIPLELFHRLVREAVNERFGCVVDDLAGTSSSGYGAATSQRWSTRWSCSAR